MGERQVSTQLPVAERRAANKMSMLSHTAVRVRDLEKTRQFYEDIVGLPLVSTQVITMDPETKEPTSYVHCFFELADGGTIAFFQFAEGVRGPQVPHTSDAFERHLAIRTGSEKNVLDLYKRYQDAGIETFTVDHDWCFSVYGIDPDDDTFEVTYHRPSADQVLNMPDAHTLLKDWLATLDE